MIVVPMRVQAEPTVVPMTIGSDGQTIGMTIGAGYSVVQAQEYDGPYEVIPKAHTDQILETEGLFMTDDVTVFKVPYYETSNLFDGKTAYIAEEV